MTAQLIVKCNEYLQAVREFADRTNQHQPQEFKSRLGHFLQNEVLVYRLES
jgi:hypothetical protein